MKQLRHRSIVVLAVCVFGMMMPSLSFAQSGTRQSGSGTQQRGTTLRQQGSTSRSTVQNRDAEAVRTQATFEQRFWDYLQRQKYRNWAPVPGKSEKLSEGQSPHGAYLKMYLNRIAAGNPQKLPHGSMIIKENYGPDQKTLMAITVMYRTKDYNPKGGDWYWAKFNTDGTVARTPQEKGNLKIAGKFESCINCHAGADGNDFSFMNDK